MESDVESENISETLSGSPLSPLFCDSGSLFSWEEIEKVYVIKNKVTFDSIDS